MQNSTRVSEGLLTMLHVSIAKQSELAAAAVCHLCQLVCCQAGHCAVQRAANNDDCCAAQAEDEPKGHPLGQAALLLGQACCCSHCLMLCGLIHGCLVRCCTCCILLLLLRRVRLCCCDKGVGVCCRRGAFRHFLMAPCAVPCCFPAAAYESGLAAAA
jgi:hypothetical protein